MRPSGARHTGAAQSAERLRRTGAPGRSRRRRHRQAGSRGAQCPYREPHTGGGQEHHERQGAQDDTAGSGTTYPLGRTAAYPRWAVRRRTPLGRVGGPHRFTGVSAVRMTRGPAGIAYLSTCS
ncbi:hypothetical protein GCM10018787_29480 [Streptomyces thermodiastaticus]|nr:hypothetical protein GCM10018787_29480 [Streptomyces thermodiastaticus]